MKINKEKTKLMLFNTARTRDFSSILEIEGEQIEVVEQQKLLGVQIPNYLKWNVNASYIVKRGYNKLWMIRRLKGKWNQPTNSQIYTANTLEAYLSMQQQQYGMQDLH